MNEVSEQNNSDKIKQLLFSTNYEDIDLALMIAESNRINLEPIILGLKKILAISKITPTIKDWENAPLDKLIHVTGAVSTLAIEDCSLDYIPDEIALFKNLFLIEIHRTDLKILNSNIRYLRNLISLSLKSNQLETVPDEITQLKLLKSLNLHDNLLHSLPESIHKLENLSTLELSKNPLLLKLPDNLKEMQNLKRLVLDKAVFNYQIPGNILPLKADTLVLWEEIKPLFGKS